MKEKLDIVFLGGLFPNEKEVEILKNSTGAIQSAANVLQWKIVNGLDLNLDEPVNIVNSLYIDSFPIGYKKLIIKSYRFNHLIKNKKCNDFNVGFINLIGTKAISKLITLKFHIRKWALDGKKNKIIIAYSLTSTNLRIFKYLKKINPLIKTCIIVTDLPQYMNTTNKKTNIIFNLFNKIDIKNISKLLKYSDRFVLLTKYMKDKLFIKENQYIVIEGISTVEQINKYNKDDNDVKIILYTGSLNEKYGVLNLINAFKDIKNNKYKLIFCGNGDSLDKIIEASKGDARIIFKGILSREKVLALQVQATVLINPRQNNNEFCKYSFPSKIMEYLSSGTPIIAYKLSGIPNEYDKYINYVEDDSKESLINKIIEVCEDDYDKKKKIAKEAKEFVLKNKNSKVQCKKILNMMIGF